MNIVTTPMCKDVLEIAGVSEFEVSLDPDSTDADIAIVLSETNTQMKSVKIKLNTFSQIKNSIELIIETFETEGNLYDPEVYDFQWINHSGNRNIKVKVYSNFLIDIVEDIGYTVVSEGQDHQYLVYPDYMAEKILDEIDTMGDRAVEVPSHKNTPKNPIERAKLRYKLLEKKLCMKP